MKLTRYFERRVKRKHPEANRTDWIELVLADPYDSEEQEDDGRLRYFGFITEVGRWMRVVVEPDGETVHNAFFDDGYAGDVRRLQ